MKKTQSKHDSGFSVLKPFNPLTTHQQEFCEDFRSDPFGIFVLNGCPGTGKSFIAMHEALNQILNKEKFDRLIIVRSPVQTRDMGFMPGSREEKEHHFFEPYPIITRELTGDSKSWHNLVDKGIIEVMGTSFMRGLTFNNSIIYVDEFQNCNFHELDTIITRIGKKSSIIFSGDYNQSDLQKKSEKNSCLDFLAIVSKLKNSAIFEFNWQDIVRNEIVRNYLYEKERYFNYEDSQL